MLKNPFDKIVENSESDLLESILGDITATGLPKLASVLPKQISDVLIKGFQGANLEGLFSDAFGNILGNKVYGKILETFQKIGEVASKSWEKADQAAYTYGKRLGLTSTQVEGLRNSILDLSEKSVKFGISYGKTLEDVIKLQGEFASSLGRTVKLTNEQLEDISALSAIVGDEMAVKFSAQLENFGMSASSAGELMTKMFNRSVKQGITLESYSKNVTDNLHLAQQYTFKNGVDGLMSMAENAAKMKLDMQQVVSLGNSIANGGIEKAVSMSAELQVLGGAFAQFADPLALLHDSLLDMDGLSNRITGLIGEIGRFDKKEGRVVIDPFSQFQLRQASQSMGLDYGKLIESANQQAKRKEIESQLVGLSNIPQEYKELIMNTAQFKDGYAGVRSSDGTFKKLASLNGDDLKSLADFAKTDSENIRDIAQMLRGMTDIREGMEKEKENERATLYRTQSEHIKGIYRDLGESKEALQRLVKIELGNVVRDTLVSPIGGLGKKGLGMLGQMISKKADGGVIYTHNSGGGVITNGEPGKEYILNSAQHGEFIVNKSSVEHYLPLLNLINGDKNGGLLNALFNPKEFLGKYTDVIQGAIEKQAVSLRKERISITNELKNIEIGSEQYEKLVEQRDKITEKLNKKMSFLGKNSEELSKKMAKISKGVNIATKVGGSALAGAAALTTSIKTYRADGTMVMNHGKAVGGTIGATAGATIGAALGSFAGPIGMMIGGAIGQYAGQKIGEFAGTESKVHMRSSLTKITNNMENIAGKNALLTLKGDFSTKEMKQLSEALADGKLYERELKNKNLIEKLKVTGNENIFEKHARGGLLIGKSHANGGIKTYGHEFEGGEFIINSGSTSRSMGLLNDINNGKINDSNIKSIEPMGKQMKVKESYSQNNSPQTMKMEPLTININGTIKLETNDKTFDISDELFKNPTLINKLTDIITKQINIDDNFAFDRKNYRRKYSIF